MTMCDLDVHDYRDNGDGVLVCRECEDSYVDAEHMDADEAVYTKGMYERLLLDEPGNSYVSAALNGVERRLAELGLVD